MIKFENSLMETFLPRTTFCLRIKPELPTTFKTVTACMLTLFISNWKYRTYLKYEVIANRNIFLKQ